MLGVHKGNAFSTVGEPVENAAKRADHALVLKLSTREPNK
jgi:hypothetical protein